MTDKQEYQVNHLLNSIWKMVITVIITTNKNRFDGTQSNTLHIHKDLKKILNDFWCINEFRSYESKIGITFQKLCMYIIILVIYRIALWAAFSEYYDKKTIRLKPVLLFPKLVFNL